MKASSWSKLVLVGTLSLLGLIALATVIIDPFLHYHAPLSFLQYPLKDERYQNDGMMRNYEYDALITGTSMTQNFKASEMDALWGVNSLKASYSGASYHELCENIERAFLHQPDIKYVICSMDGNMLITPSDADNYTEYPEYLYDNNIFNDVSYLWNKEVVPKTIAVINYTRAGEQTPTRDEYGSWGQYKNYGRDVVVATKGVLPEIEQQDVFTEEERVMVTENITKNFLATAKAHPDTEFYLFFPPYSVCDWEALIQLKHLDSYLEAKKLAVELLLEAENINVFSFADRLDITGNLDNYADTLHYGPWVNSEILNAMYLGENELTRETYQNYYNNVREIYMKHEFDY